MTLRRDLFRLLRLWDDARAARKGPKALARRMARRRAHSATNRATRRLLRKVGL